MKMSTETLEIPDIWKKIIKTAAAQLYLKLNSERFFENNPTPDVIQAEMERRFIATFKETIKAYEKDGAIASKLTQDSEINTLDHYTLIILQAYANATDLSNALRVAYEDQHPDTHDLFQSRITSGESPPCERSFLSEAWTEKVGALYKKIDRGLSALDDTLGQVLRLIKPSTIDLRGKRVIDPAVSKRLAGDPDREGKPSSFLGKAHMGIAVDSQLGNDRLPRIVTLPRFLAFASVTGLAVAYSCGAFSDNEPTPQPKTEKFITPAPGE